MKAKVTMREVKASFPLLVSIGYCDLQTLLSYKSPIAYTCGVYGWNANIYDFGTCAIVTGYRPFGNVHPDYITIRKYEAKAIEIKDTTTDYTERIEKLNSLISDFIKEVC